MFLLLHWKAIFVQFSILLKLIFEGRWNHFSIYSTTVSTDRTHPNKMINPRNVLKVQWMHYFLLSEKHVISQLRLLGMFKLLHWCIEPSIWTYVYHCHYNISHEISSNFHSLQWIIISKGKHEVLDSLRNSFQQTKQFWFLKNLGQERKLLTVLRNKICCKSS